MTDPAITAAADQYAAASAEARRTLTELALPGTRPRVGVEAPSWVARIRDMIMAVEDRRGCRHVTGGAHQPINILAWAPEVSLCSPCARHPATLAHLAAAHRPTPVCDACGHAFDEVTLAVFQPQSVPFLVWVGLCDPCLRTTTNPPGETHAHN